MDQHPQLLRVSIADVTNSNLHALYEVVRTVVPAFCFESTVVLGSGAVLLLAGDSICRVPDILAVMGQSSFTSVDSRQRRSFGGKLSEKYCTDAEVTAQSPPPTSPTVLVAYAYVLDVSTCLRR